MLIVKENIAKHARPPKALWSLVRHSVGQSECHR